jgi:hypothetical protein
MPDEVTLDVTTIEENVTVETTAGDVVEIQVVAPAGPAGDTGPAGPNSVTSATTSDSTANLSIADLEVVGGEIYTDGDYSQIYTQGTDAHIFTLGSGAEIFTEGELAQIYTTGASAQIYTAGAGATIGTQGANATIYTQGANATISTAGSAAHIQTSHANAAVKSTNFAAVESGGASLVDGSFQPCLTWSAGGRNLTIPSGTAVTFDSTSYTYGTGAAAAHRTALGLTTLATTTPAANVANFLATPTSANLASALTDENGTGGGFVRAEGATLTSPSIAGTAAFTGATRPTSNALNPTMADGSLIARQDLTRDFTSFYIRNQMAWEAGPWVTTGTGPRNTIDGNNLGGMRIIGTTQLASASSLGAGIKYPDGAFTGQTMIRFSAVWHARLLTQNYFSLNSAVAFIFGVRNMAGFWSNSSIGLYHVPQPTNTWAATNVYAVGDRINVSGIVQIVSTAGISGISEPAFNATRNGTTADGTVTWRNLGPHTSNKWALCLIDAAGAITIVDTGVAWVTINTATTLLSIRSDGTNVLASVNGSTEVSVARGALSAAHPYILARQDIVGAGEISGLLFTFEKPLQF